jgi:hypothetical protein
VAFLILGPGYALKYCRGGVTLEPLLEVFLALVVGVVSVVDMFFICSRVLCYFSFNWKLRLKVEKGNHLPLDGTLKGFNLIAVWILGKRIFFECTLDVDS